MRPLVGNVHLGHLTKIQTFFPRPKHVSRMSYAYNYNAVYVLSAFKFTTHICFKFVFVSQTDILKWLNNKEWYNEFHSKRGFSDYCVGLICAKCISKKYIGTY